MKLFRIIWKSFIITLSAFVLLFSIAAGTTYFFKDKIAGVLIGELNKNLATEIQVSKIDLNLLDKFPYLSLKFKDVKIKEPKGFSDSDFAVAKSLYFTFNPIDLIQENYQIEQVYLENALVNIVINKNNEGNYSIFKSDSTSSDNSVSFDLKKITLQDVLLNLDYQPGEQYYSIHNNQTSARLKKVNELYTIDLNGDLMVYDINIADQSYFKGKNVKIRSSQKYSNEEKYFTILPSQLFVEGSAFNLSGIYDFKDRNHIDIDLEGQKGRIQTLLSLLPADLYNSLKMYESTGKIYFKGKVEGEVSAAKNPLITVDFGFENASFTHPEMGGQVSNATLTGSFSNGKARKSESSVLRISKFKASFQDHPFKGSFLLKNFSNPFIEFSCNGSVDLGSFIKFYPVTNVKSAQGLVTVDLNFAGRPDDVQNYPDRIETSGEIKVKNTAFSLKDLNYNFSSLNGHFLFNRNDVAFNDFSGKINTSDFLINGYFRNLIGKILYNQEKLAIAAFLYSDNLDINDLLASSSGPETNSKTSGSSHFLENYQVSLNCNIKNLKYNKINIQNLQGQFNIRHPHWSFENVSGNLCGGNIAFNSKISFSDKTEVRAKADFANLKIEELFTAFENFDQDYLTGENLKGTLTGNTELLIPFNKNNEVIYPDLQGEVKISVKNGELIGFSPMQKLSLFIDEHELYDVKFSELSNELIIRNNEINIPEMEIKSNVSNIAIKGSHSFDNVLNYKLTVPLKNFKKKDKDESFGAVEEDNRGNSVVYLKIEGPADDFKIKYDTRRTGQKIKYDLKREGDEISDILKGKKREEQKDAELNQNDYFNF